MSFKEIKSLLRMVNVDMNDMYAYRLFKVGTSALSSPDHSSHLFSFPSSSRGDRSLLQQNTPGSTYLHALPQGCGTKMGELAQSLSSPSGRPQGQGGPWAFPHSQVSSEAVVLISLKPFAQVTCVVCTQEQREEWTHGPLCTPSSIVARVAPPHLWEHRQGHTGLGPASTAQSEHMADPCPACDTERQDHGTCAPSDGCMWILSSLLPIDPGCERGDLRVVMNGRGL